MDAFQIKIITRATAKKQQGIMKSYVEGIQTCFNMTLDRAIETTDLTDDIFGTSRIFALVTGRSNVAASCILAINKKYNTCEIRQVCIQEQHKGKGLCKTLLKLALDYLKDIGIYQAQIYCMEKYLPAFKCYSKLFPDHHAVLGKKIKYHAFVKFLI